MGGIIEIGSAILSESQQALEVVAQNLANVSTPGYRALRPFSALASNFLTENSLKDAPSTYMDPRNGKLQKTANPLDFALDGDGFFVLRAGDSIYYSRNGQFTRDGQGRIMTADGLVLQGDGGDILVKGEIRITEQGIVLDDGAPVARLDLVARKDLAKLTPFGGGLFQADSDGMIEASALSVRQGMLETSNVASADEMLAMMAAIRRAEAGQNLVRLYDDLVGRAIETFEQNSAA